VHVIVMGCGRVGASLALQLQRLEHSVAVIDMDPGAFRRLGEGFTGQRVTGVGFDRNTLREAGAERAAALAAVSNGDNSNIIAARVARETFGVARVIARIYDERRAEVVERLGIPTIATVPWAAGRLLRALLGPSAAELWRDPSGTVVMVEVTPHEGWIGSPLREFEAATGSRVGYLTRFGAGELPTESTIIQDGDLVHALTTDEHLPLLRELAARAPEGGR